MFHWLTAFESGIKFKGKTLNSSLVGKYECSCFTSSQTRHQQFLKRINPSFTQNTLWMQRCGVELLWRSRCMLSSRVMQFTRVPNRFFGIRDLAYFKVGIRDFEGKGGRNIRDCNYDRDSGYGDFNKRESANAACKKPRFGNFKDWNMQRKSGCHLIMVGNSRTMS